MTGKVFHINVFKDKILLSWGSQQGIPYRMASDLEKDRLIAKILHKILNLRLSGEEWGVLGKDEFRVLGGTLFKLLFSDNALKLQFQTFYREALNRGEERYRLVIELDKDAEEMAILPWEYLFYEEDAVQEAFLAAHPKKCIDILRKLPNNNNWLDINKDFQIQSPLRILVIAANPDTDLYINQMQATLAYFKSLESRFVDRVKVDFLEQPTLENFENQLSQALKNGSPHVVHFAGRGRMDGENGQLCFVKRNPDGKFVENWISDDIFAGYFEEWRQLPHLVVLHVCDATPIGSYLEERGTALRLAKKGVPFVLALQNPVPEWIAQMLIEKMYDNLLDGMDVNAALTEGRFFLARKLIDPSGRKYDNYEHKSFGSIVLFSNSLQPFSVGQPTPLATPSAVPPPGTTIRNMPLPTTIGTNASGTMVSPLVFSSSFPGAPQETARSNASTTQTEPNRSDAVANALQKERDGLEGIFIKLVEKLNFYRTEYVKITDLAMKFQAQEDIKALEIQVEQIKIKLGIAPDNRAG